MFFDERIMYVDEYEKYCIIFFYNTNALYFLDRTFEREGQIVHMRSLTVLIF